MSWESWTATGASLGISFIAVLIAGGIAIVGTRMILKIVDVRIGLRVPADHEVQGLDLSQHAEEGYY